MRTIALAFLGLAACGNAPAPDPTVDTSKATPSQGYGQPVPATTVEQASPVAAGGAADAGHAPVADAAAPSAHDASPDAAATACKDLGRCCAKVIACDGETLACMRVVLSDDATACTALIKSYDAIGCDHSNFTPSPQYANFYGCAPPSFGGGN